jgi:hypothetical protein
MLSRPIARAGLVAALVALVLLGTGGPPVPADAASTTGAACVTFPETGKTVCGRFLEYWQGNGGLAQQGFPLTDEFTEINPTDNKPYLTQYFERARFEYHPENQPPYDVLLGLLGREQLLAKYGGTAPPGTAGNPLGTDCATFPETGKQVCGVFRDYWIANGGLAQQGLPLTDLFLETNPTDGKQYPTQYFERARFEYHAENIGTPYVVLLGLLGREQLLAKYPNGVPPGPAPSAQPSPSVAPTATRTAAPAPTATATRTRTPIPSPSPRATCDPSYPTVCIPPPPPDLDCKDIPHRNFPVRAPDPHGFDSNDNDGIGCES